ncbi:hypothetical protein [Spiroplasma endosymbiont of Nebria brevicollis]|uniref:hypothetical protein n=1 Tax=Spiroplasma endosymbiont of Nebria brevicollis TaxID=3066284 RepID=UPI00313ADFC8
MKYLQEIGQTSDTVITETDSPETIIGSLEFLNVEKVDEYLRYIENNQEIPSTQGDYSVICLT